MDDAGLPVRSKERDIVFSVAGSARNIGVDNGSPTISGDLKSDTCRTDQGRCLMILQAGDHDGPTTITATADGLAPATLEIVQTLASVRQ